MACARSPADQFASSCPACEAPENAVFALKREGGCKNGAVVRLHSGQLCTQCHRIVMHLQSPCRRGPYAGLKI